MLTVWCYVLAWAAPWSLGCAVVFTALQSWRARVEERLLLSKLPGYAEYHARTGFLLPRLSALGNAARGSRRAPP
jgi:protein-S-isoprenylcysteine O-methyltransferase Ste14